MSEDCRRNINRNPSGNRSESEAEATAIAYNRNFNILFYPNDETVYADALGNSAEDAVKKAQSPEDFLSSLFNQKRDEALSVSKAEGKAAVFNANVNVVVRVD